MSASLEPVTAEVVEWALREDGASWSSIARGLKVDEGTLASWATGEALPTRGQLTQLAERLGRPRALFFLPQPPSASGLPTAFRHAPGEDDRVVPSPTRRVVRRARRVQGLVAWVRRQGGESAVDLLKASVSDEPEVIAVLVREWLQVGLGQQQSWADDRAALRAWRTALQERGVLAFQFSMGADGPRGFSAWDELAPLVAANSYNDRPAARVFTYMHELGHLVIRSDAACLDWVVPAARPDLYEERWCDAFAAALLLPRQAVTTSLKDRQGVADSRSSTATLADVANLARAFNVSGRATAVRLIQLGLADASLYAQVDGAFKVKPAAKSSGGGGTPRPELRVREYGAPVVRDLLVAAERGRLNLRDATSTLNMPVGDARAAAEIVGVELSG